MKPVIYLEEERKQTLDEFIGIRVKARRSLMGFSQEKLGGFIGLTFQQIQKYEKGINRISASKLYRISEILEVPIEHFFDGFGAELNENKSEYSADVMKKKETFELVRAYYNIHSPEVRKNFLSLLKSMSEDRKKK